MKRRILSILLALSLTAPCSAQAASTGTLFIDVPLTHWAASQIQYFAQQGIIDGKPDGTFAPDEGVTREAFAKMLVLTFHANLVTPPGPSFTDVSEDRWSYPYIETAKDFLTNYVSPFDASVAFHPEELAVREDIAVALVRMLGLSASDAKNPNYAKYVFTDAADITPELLPYVSLAAERGLIRGYQNGTFGPTRSVTRAETVAMLGRVTKQAVAETTSELSLSTNVAYSPDGKTAYITILTEEGASVRIDGEELTTEDASAYGYASGTVLAQAAYTFETEGSRKFTVIAEKLSKVKETAVTVTYETEAPKLTILYCPESVATPEITLTGRVTGGGSDLLLTVNDEPIEPDETGNWSQPVLLSEGENRFVFVASGDNGKRVTETRSIFFRASAPELLLYNCPAVSARSQITVEGRVKGEEVRLYLNDEPVTLETNGSFSIPVDLETGKNVLNFRAVNAAGKESASVQVVEYEPPVTGAPEIDPPETTPPTASTPEMPPVSGDPETEE